MGSAIQTSLVLALFTAMAIRPPRPRHSSPFNLQFAFGYLINEQPFLGGLWLATGTWELLTAAPSGLLWWLVAALTTADAAALAWLAVRTRSARPALTAALLATYGEPGRPRATRPVWWRVLLVPFISWRPDVRRVRNRRYGPARRGNRLDVYLSRRRRPSSAPVLVYIHGGGFRIGNKMIGARPLIYRLAARGWVCVSLDHRLIGVDYADQLGDTRAALAWIRAHIGAYGGDPNAIVLAGGSSGAHLASTAALSGEEVLGVIGIYGYYGGVGGAGTGPASPHEAITPDAPPFLIIHGTLDTLVLREDARAFAQRLRAVSRRPVTYAELPGAQHSFDLFHSLRFTAVSDTIVRFLELTLATDTTLARTHHRSRPGTSGGPAAVGATVRAHDRRPR
ncbi:alpha/beta hydrolase fold domain-containing protein [Pseudactinotalea sp. HY160]|uniref:alpha/beta hydrolase n=1 Tax=Pseudactinotalea sp. HY160 TaxID=2654490 RepID=UPI00128AFFBE|nr:alpha/beta hydrolase [Pseudactinotalea sp. HY160]MPV51234.1 alpha/beta hydrolase fold domain-containing protein [Pseudactinotalea sp. HY160]